MNQVYPVSKDVIKKAMVILGKSRHAGRNQLMLSFMLSVPLRVSDVVSLKVEDVYNKKGFKLLQQKTGSKTGKKIDVIIPKQIQQLIKNHVDKSKLRKNQFLFTSQKGGKLTTRQVYEIINPALKKAGAKEAVGCHSTRKTWAVTALEQYGPDAIPWISRMLGHTSIENTRYYLHLTQDQDRTMIEDMPVYMPEL